MKQKTLEAIVELTKAIREKKEAGVSDAELENFIKEQFSKISDEQEAISKTVVNDNQSFKSISELLSIPTNDPQVKKAQELNDGLYLLSVLTREKASSFKMFREFASTLKSINTQTAGEGLEYVPTGLSPRLWDRVRLELKVAKLFTDIPMPTNPYTTPLILGDTSAYYVPESTDDEIVTPSNIPSSKPTTGSFTLTAKKIATKILVSEEATEDSIVPILPILETNLAIGIANAIENAIINGDTGSTPMDADLTSSSDPRKSLNGLRVLTPSSCKVALSSPATLLEGLRAMRATMGIYGVNPAQLVYITSLMGYLSKLLSMSQVITVDKYGANATIMTGELGKVDGIPIVVSEAYKENLDNTGVVPSGGGGTDTAITLVNRNAYVLGTRRTIKIALGDDITNDQKVIVASVRKAFTPAYGSSATSVSYGYAMNGSTP